MNTLELQMALRYVGRCVVLPIDKIKFTKTDGKPLGLVINTDRSDGPGEHWVAVFLDGKGCGEYFDSFGLPPLRKGIITFMNRNCPVMWSYNTTTVQEFDETVCGNWCVNFLKAKFAGLKFDEFILRP